MRHLLLLTALAAVSLPQQGGAQPAPVVLELYTSQGCASCPPADALLGELARIDGVIALALHVDYWDYLGWADSFGQAAYADRQRAYAKAAKSRTVYTPEMVVQGTDRLKGHDAERIRERIAAHQASSPSVALTLTPQGEDLAIRIEPMRADVGPADVHVAHFIPEEEVAIGGGENAGRTVTYSNIVTDWQTIGGWDGAAPVELRYEDAGEGPLAVIVQRAKMGPVLGAARWP